MSDGREMGNVLRNVRLENDLLVEFFDRSNRYFGDYHRVCVEVRCRIPLTADFFAGSVDPVAELQAAKTMLGNEVVFARTLEKMGVAGEEVERAREALVDSFIRSSLLYLDTPTFPRRFVGAELARCRQGRRLPWPRL